MNEQDLALFQKTIISDENNHIFVQPLCDFFGISNQNQSRIIKTDPILSKEWTKKSNEFLFGDKHSRNCLSKKGFLRWIQLISPNIVKQELKEKLIEYQVLVFDYIYGSHLIPNLKRQYEIDNRLKELNKIINQSMVEHRELSLEKKLLTINNYTQMGLPFEEDYAKPVKKINK